MKRKMKKTVAGILAAMLILSCGAAGVSAAGHGRERNHAGRGMGDGCGYRSNVCQYADEDADGVCDNYVERAAQNNCGKNYTDTDEDGACDNYETGHGRGCRGGHSK